LAIKQQGFTLIEILLVIVIATVLSAMVAPSFFASTGVSLKSEARYMQKVLRLAAEESQLRGKPIRCSVYAERLIFEMPNRDGVWMPLADEIFQSQMPQAPITVKSAHLEGGVDLVGSETLNNGEKPPLTRFMFWPDGRVSAGELVLSIEPKEQTRTIKLHAGLGGIHVQD